MSLKTEKIYNGFDFVEIEGELRELTVTISLAEYRDLVEGAAYDTDLINRLNDEITQLTLENESLKMQIAKAQGAV